jgi:hypothetical protein
MRVVLHIGVEKTGTSSIQAHCHRHARALATHGVLYPARLGFDNQVHLVTAFAPFDANEDLRSWAGIRSEAEHDAFRDRVLASLRRQVAQSRPSCLLLSSEHLSSRCGRATIERLRDFLAELADEVRVVVYLRRQDDALASLYSTYLKSQGTEGLDYVVKAAWWLDYDQLLGIWADVFGRERMEVRLFPPKSRTLIEDFAAAAGLPALPADPADARVNPSLDQRNLLLLERINAVLPLYRDGAVNPDRGGLAAFLERRSKGRGFALARHERQALLASFAAGNERVRAAYFPDLPMLFDEKMPDAEPVTELTLDDAIDLAVEVWVEHARLRRELDAHRRREPGARAASWLRRLRRRPGAL